MAARYLRLFTEGTRVEVEVSGELVRVAQHIIDPAGAGSRQIADLGASFLVRFCRILTGTMLAPAWVELPFASSDDAEHRRVLGAPVRLNQPRTVVVLDRRQLALRAVGADPDLFDILEQVCRERVGALADPQDPRVRAETVIIELLPYGAPSIDRVARRLGTSSRSLGRRLGEQRTSYKALVDDIRCETRSALSGAGLAPTKGDRRSARLQGRQHLPSCVPALDRHDAGEVPRGG